MITELPEQCEFCGNMTERLDERACICPTCDILWFVHGSAGPIEGVGVWKRILHYPRYAISTDYHIVDLDKRESLIPRTNLGLKIFDRGHDVYLWNGSRYVACDPYALWDQAFNPKGHLWYVCHEWFREIFLCQMLGYRHAIWDRLYEEHKLSGREDPEFYEDMSHEFYQKHIEHYPGWRWARDGYYTDSGDSFHERAGLMLWSKIYGPPRLPITERLVMEDIAKEDRQKLPKIGQELF